MSMRPCSGFTLIEMMIAVALSTMIVYVAMAGFRVASQSTTMANRMSLENALMRAGYQVAVEEADFWQSYDDPDVAGSTPLRAFDDRAGWRRGMPFTPFDASAFPRGGTPGGDNERGWDPEFQWPANDSRTWFHGNLVEQVWNTKHVFGHYELFAHAKTNPRLDRVFDGGVAFAGTGAVRPTHTWMCNQLEGLKNALGYYGVCEYMPANAIYGVVGDPGGDNIFGTGDDTDQRMQPEWCSPEGSGGGVQWRFANDDGGTQWARGLYRHTRDSTFPLIPVSQWTAARTDRFSPEERVKHQYRSWATNRVGSAAGTDGIKDLLAKAMLVRPLLGRPGPAHWPEVSIGVMRFLSNCRYVTLCKVRWVSALTGQQAELSFSLLATSLRGARQQRAPGGGWAVPGGPTLDRP